MAFRLIHVLAEGLDSEGVCGALEGCAVVDRFDSGTGGEREGFALVVLEEATEGVVEKLRDAFGDSAGFRVVITELSAVWPEPERSEAVENRIGWRRLGRISREELLADVEPGSRAGLIYLVQVVISVLVASVGMIRDQVAVVIGAMVIAPLLLPNMSLALGVVVGDLKMALRSLRALGAGLLVGLIVALLVGWGAGADPEVDQIAQRGVVTWLDMVTAAAAGMAGALAVTTGVSANLIGVMVAVALVPPLGALGLLVGAGDFRSAGGAATLLGVNVVSVVLAAVVVFLVQGIRAATWYEAKDAKKGTLFAVVMCLVLLGGLAGLVWFLGTLD